MEFLDMLFYVFGAAGFGLTVLYPWEPLEGSLIGFILFLMTV
jgi:hypothetical protein